MSKTTQTDLGGERATKAENNSNIEVEELSIDDIADRPHYAFFSGGDHSLVSTHYYMENGIAEEVVYIDTKTGPEVDNPEESAIAENKQYIKDVCERYGWPLTILDEPTLSLAEFGKRYGLPKSGAHGWAFRYFKEHQASSFASNENELKPVFCTGVFEDESDRRAENVRGRLQDRDRWTYRSDLWEKPEEWFAEYRETHDLPSNPVREKGPDGTHLTGDCFCGAFGSRYEELSILEEEYPKHAEYILDVEREIQEEIGADKDWCYWGQEGLSHPDLREEMVENPRASQSLLCSGCGSMWEDVVCIHCLQVIPRAIVTDHNESVHAGIPENTASFIGIGGAQ